MRTPKYLSHSSLSLWDKDKQEFYMKHLADTKAPRIVQENYMSIGASFDAYAKSRLHEALFGAGSDPEFEFQAIFEAQVEPENRDFALAAGQYVFDSYVLTGAFDELLGMLQKSKETPRFEFEVSGEIGGVPFLGKPDCRFVHECGVHVILDWKVKGFCSKYTASPSKNFRLCRDGYGEPFPPSRTHGKPHPKYKPYDHHGLEINEEYLENGNAEYASQLCKYGWLLGEEIGDEEVVAFIDEIVSKPMPERYPLLRVAQHRGRVSKTYQEAILGKAQECWKAITTGWVFQDLPREENDELCTHLEKKVIALQSDGSPEEDMFAKIARPQLWR